MKSYMKRGGKMTQGIEDIVTFEDALEEFETILTKHLEMRQTQQIYVVHVGAGHVRMHPEVEKSFSAVKHAREKVVDMYNSK